MPSPTSQALPAPAPVPDDECAEYVAFLDTAAGSLGTKGNCDEFPTSPLVSWEAIKAARLRHLVSGSSGVASEAYFPQYGLLGRHAGPTSSGTTANPVFANTNAPWSAFLCGSQGSGKSHTLSCILENCLIKDKRIGKLETPLAGLMFYFDPHSSSICEAAHLASAGVKVQVLVSPSNYTRMRRMYGSIAGGSNITIRKFYLSPQDLTTERLKRLMGVGDDNDILYMESIVRILRDLRMENEGSDTDLIDYAEFRRRLHAETFSNGQLTGLRLRLQLLESILDTTGMQLDSLQTLGKRRVVPQSKATMTTSQYAFRAEPGTLTIMDLTDPFMDASSACTLFEICLSLFLTHSELQGKIVALDEAHNYMDRSSSSDSFTNSLLRSIREQRHKALRVVIATQEPTINPTLLDLCSMTFVHRFTSPQWMEVLRKHLGGLAMVNSSKSSRSSSPDGSDDLPSTAWDSDTIRSATPDIKADLVQKVSDFPTVTASSVSDVFESVMRLRVGEALVFAPAGVVSRFGSKMGSKFIQLQVRPRLSNDGGRSRLAHGN